MAPTRTPKPSAAPTHERLLEEVEKRIEEGRRKYAETEAQLERARRLLDETEHLKPKKPAGAAGNE
jgi:hypothetical protein